MAKLMTFKRVEGLATLANKDPDDGEVLEGILGYLERRSPCFRVLDITRQKYQHRKSCRCRAATSLTSWLANVY